MKVHQHGTNRRLRSVRASQRVARLLVACSVGRLLGGVGSASSMARGARHRGAWHEARRATAKHGWSGRVAPWRAVLSRGRAPGERAGKKRESRVGERREEHGKCEPGGASRAKEEEGGFSPWRRLGENPGGRGLGLGARFMGQNG
jgi:hypothetical protein